MCPMLVIGLSFDLRSALGSYADESPRCSTNDLILFVEACCQAAAVLESFFACLEREWNGLK